MKKRLFQRITPEQREREQLMREIVADVLLARREMEAALLNFNFASSDELIDVYSYQLSAARAKCDYLMRRAKQHGLAIPGCVLDNMVIG